MESITVKLARTRWETFKTQVLSTNFVAENPRLVLHTKASNETTVTATFYSDNVEDLHTVVNLLPANTPRKPKQRLKVINTFRISRGDLRTIRAFIKAQHEYPDSSLEFFEHDMYVSRLASYLTDMYYESGPEQQEFISNILGMNKEEINKGVEVYTDQKTTRTVVKMLYNNIITDCQAAQTELELHPDLSKKELLYWIDEIQKTINMLRKEVTPMS